MAPQLQDPAIPDGKAICIFGAGAIGGALAARLATAPELAKATLSVVARGAHLQAIRENGIHVWAAGSTELLVARVNATDKAADLGKQDLVIVTLKGHQLTAAIDDIAGLLKPNGRVVMIQNGIPWWYFHGDTTSGLEGRRLDALDPGGLIWNRIGPERVIGGVIYQGAQMSEPGHVRLSGYGLLHIGEPSGVMSDDLWEIASLLQASGWTVKPTDRIRDEIWLKLQGNAAFNPISALTRTTVSAMLADAGLLELTRQVMTEVRDVAEALGCRISLTIDERLDHSRALGTARTSMLQDVEQGRRLEVIPLTRAVSLLGNMAGVPTPANDIILALVSELDRSLSQAR